MSPEIRLFNEDCMHAMRRMKDNEFSLAIVDPPYGIDICKSHNIGGNPGLNYIATQYDIKKWDCEKPSVEYFEELFRITKNRVIWGYNYFSDMLPPCRGVVFWDKLIGDNNFSGGELAWTSYDRPLRIFRHYHGGNRVSNNYEKAKQYARIHPTQKPVRLYEWLLNNYAKPGDRILDTHCGSGSILIACDILGFSIDAYEIDADYFQAAKERLERHQRQQVLDLK